MRRFTVISILMMYLVLNLGISIKIHYCGDTISYVDLFALKTKKCCGDVEASCCKDKYAYVKPDTKQSIQEAFSFSIPDYAAFAEEPQDLSDLSQRESLLVRASSRGIYEPHPPGVPLYLLHREIIV